MFFYKTATRLINENKHIMHILFTVNLIKPF